MLRHDPAQSTLLRAALNGTYYTASHAVMMRKIYDPSHPWCGQEDTPQHRHVECPAHDALRLHLDGDVSKWLKQQDVCTQAHGWIEKIGQDAEWAYALASIVDTVQEFQHGPGAPSEGCLDIFTDGSCLRPHCPWTRILSWVAVLCTDYTNPVFRPIADGIVPGSHHSSIRGELWAM